MDQKHTKSLSISLYTVVVCVMIVIAYAGSSAVTAISEIAPIKNRYTIIIDAGHGGLDGGATSCTGIAEKTLNLEFAIRLNDLLHLLGIETVMIRSEDTSVDTSGDTIAARKISDLKQRVKIVNNTNDGVLISIHQNYFTDSQYYGPQVFYSKTSGSEIFANDIQQAFNVHISNGKGRKTKEAKGIYLMEQIKCPGILIECGFLSNPQEESLLRDSEYQKKLCCIIASVTGKYISGRTSA